MNWGAFAGGVAQGIPVGTKLISDARREARDNEELILRKAADARAAESHALTAAEIRANHAAEIMAAGGVPDAATAEAALAAGLPVSRASAAAAPEPAAGGVPAPAEAPAGGSVTLNADRVGTEPPRDAAPAAGRGLTLAQARAQTMIRERQAKEADQKSVQGLRAAQASQASAQAARIRQDTEQRSISFPTEEAARKLAYTEDQIKASAAAASRHYESAQAKSRQFEQYKDDASLADPAVRESVKSTIDDLVALHKSTPDGKAVKVAPTDGGYEVSEIDERTGKVVSTQMAATVGDVRKQLMIAGEISKKDTLPVYLASVKASQQMAELSQLKAGKDVELAKAAGEAQSRYAALMSKLQGTGREQLLDPEFRAEVTREADAIYAMAPTVFGEKRTTSKLDDAGKPIEKTESQVNGIRSTLAMLMPATEVETTNPKTGKSARVTADGLAASVVNNAPDIIKKAGGPDKVQGYIERMMVEAQLPAPTARYYAQRAAQQIQQLQVRKVQSSGTPAAMAPPAAPEAIPNMMRQAQGLAPRPAATPTPAARPIDYRALGIPGLGVPGANY